MKKSVLSVLVLIPTIALFVNSCGLPEIDRASVDQRFARLPPEVTRRLRELIFYDETIEIEAVRDDAGHYSFIRQAFPVLFGRKVRGYDELSAVHDLIIWTSRYEALEIMLDKESPYFAEYVDYWSEVVIDMLRVHRDAGDGARVAFDSCYTLPNPPIEDISSRDAGRLARCVLSAAPTGDCTVDPQQNMASLVRSALADDNLASVYRAHLFALISHPPTGFQASAQNKVDDIASLFGDAYIHRSTDCVKCHDSIQSVNGPADIAGNTSYWNRHFAIPAPFEEAFFGTPSRVQPDKRVVNFVFRTDIARSGPIDPWGIDGGCDMNFKPRGSAPGLEDIYSDYTTIVDDSGSPIVPYFTKSMDNTASIWEVDDIFKEGYHTLRLFGLRPSRLMSPSFVPDPGCTDHCDAVMFPDPLPDAPSDIDDLITDNCSECHRPMGPGAPLYLNNSGWVANVVSERVRGSWPICSDAPYYVVPGQPDESCLYRLVAANMMPSGGPALSGTEKMALYAWIAGIDDDVGPTSGCEVGAPSACEVVLAENDNEAGYAYLVAANAVNKIWQQTMGSSLTIPMYFPRNEKSRDILRQLTESNFLTADWSLKYTLLRILASEYFNRRAPDSTTLTSGYVLPTVFKPFEVNDPRRPPEAQDGWTPGDAVPVVNTAHRRVHMTNEADRSRHFNGMPDSVYRYDTFNLFRSLHRALGWRNIDRFDLPSTQTYPSENLRRAIGQYFSPSEPGFRGIQFEMMVTWEATHGQCSSENKDVTTDWIDRLMTEAASASASRALTNRDMAISVRDWLLSNGEMRDRVAVGETRSEAELVNVMFGGDDIAPVLDDNVDFTDAAAVDQVEAVLRQYCGVLLQSPQFLLAGIADEMLGPDPALRVCNDGPCTYQEICLSVSASYENENPFKRLVCGEDSLRAVDRFPGITGPDDLMCPALLCNRVPGAFIELGPECFLNPESCFPPVPPCYFHGCALVDCCGGPAPPVDSEWRFVADLEGGIVVAAQGIEVVRVGMDEAFTLQAGDRLAFRDWLIMPPGSHLQVESKLGRIETPANGVPSGVNDAGWRLQVTGPSNRIFQQARMQLNTGIWPLDDTGDYRQSPILPGAEGVGPSDALLNLLRESFQNSQENWRLDPRNTGKPPPQDDGPD